MHRLEPQICKAVAAGDPAENAEILHMINVKVGTDRDIVSFTDGYGHSWVTPGGTVARDPFVSYFFAGPESSVPPPMVEGWGGVYGTYDGQDGWIVSFF